MDTERAVIAGALALTLLIGGVAMMILSSEDSLDSDSSENMVDPLIDVEGHDHRNASQHELYTENLVPVSFNPLTAPGNAEIQVADSPDGNTYAYIAGWSELHIVDVTNPANTTVTGVYIDPNTQVLDVKYLEYNGREYVIVQNQLVDPGNADPNVGEWGDPAQVTVTLVDVTDKTDPQFVDAWYDADHPSGPHNLYTHMID
ncbi:MAG TPA: hypothetical protein QGF70_06055, partial [Candidatus Thalassarchaeaceae archaeon]|nr:hypothetical protein [Candidatus Thalassarchaeaceae archaeon]